MGMWRVEVSGDRPSAAKRALEQAGIGVTSAPVEGTVADRQAGMTAIVEADDSAEARHRVEDAIGEVEGSSVGQAAHQPTSTGRR